MPRPTSTTPGGPVARIEVPPGWLANITLVSRQTYNQLARLRYKTGSAFNTHYFSSEWGKRHEVMKESFTGLETFSITPQADATTIEFTFFHSKDKAVSGQALEQQNKFSHQLFVASVSKPKDAPKGMVDYTTFLIFVEDTAQEGRQGYDDIVATVHFIESDEVPPEKGVFENASKAVGEFQISTGIPDNLLVPPPPYSPPEDLAKLPVGIIGAGCAGLYTAMILDSLGIKYEILEASGRHGGRLYTHHFNKIQGAYQYFDAGAMRYPDIAFMKRTFDLVRERLKIGDKLIPVIMGNPNAFLHFNGHRSTRTGYQQAVQAASNANDTFRVCAGGQGDSGYVPEEFFKKGHKALYDEAIEPLRQYFVKERFPDAFKKLMEHDIHSVRSYMSIVLGYPNSVIRWIETMEWRTGMFDASLTETVLASMSFDDPQNISLGKQTDWLCFDGGSEVLADAMLAAVKTKPKFYQRMTAIQESKADGNQALIVTVDGRDDPRLANNSTADRKYSNVICTLPLSVLRTIDLDNIYLSINQRNALRELIYSPSVKIGIQFKTAWWEKLGIIGGQSYTDRPARSIVYPSHGPGLGGSIRSNVLIASYNGMQDSQRLGALMKGRNSPEEKMLLNLIMNDLAVVHGVSHEELWEQYVDYYPWDWYSSSLSLGAFAWFGPGQFKDIYPYMTMPASLKQRLFFAGEATSAAHGWVVGALNSAWRCVRAMLYAHPELNPNPNEDILKKFTDLWGPSEEWDDRVLQKHVYLGRELTKRQVGQSSSN